MGFWHKMFKSFNQIIQYSEKIPMFGVAPFTFTSSIRMKILASVRHFFGGYQPSRTYMRGEGPACRKSASRNDGTDAGGMA